jgi:hypothetical protein
MLPLMKTLLDRYPELSLDPRAVSPGFFLKRGLAVSRNVECSVALIDLSTMLSSVKTLIS